MLTIVSGLALGIAIGFRHAFEPDHLAAVSTLIDGARGGRRAALLGVWWGLGHTASLAVVGVTLIALDAALPGAVAAALELGVAAMLVTLGGLAIVRAVRMGRAGEPVRHAHGGHVHIHPTNQGHVHVLGTALALRPLLVGLVHGLAGSGALCAFAMARLGSPGSQVSFIVMFGVGSIAGMAAMTGLAGAALARMTVSVRLRAALTAVAGAVSIVTGLIWAAALA